MKEKKIEWVFFEESWNEKESTEEQEQESE